MKILIIGAGEVGSNVANRLAHENKDVVIIDKDAEALRRIADNIDVQVMVGSGHSPLILEEAGIKEAELLLAVTDKDETNLVACMAADIISPATKKLARVRNADFDEFHLALKEKPPHIDTVINPEIELVKTITMLMDVPGAADVGELGDGRIRFIGIKMEKGSRLAGAALSSLSSIIGKQRLLIAAIIRNDELIIPKGRDVLLPEDLVYFVSEQEKLRETLEIFDKNEAPLKRALIVGGGRIGLRLARNLEEKSIYTKIIEKDPERCKLLADRLNKTVILNGDGSDQELLQEENIKEMDVVITLTSDEETNILVSLLAKQMGVRKNITRINKFSYFTIMSAIGIDQVVSTRLSAIDSILRHIRRGKVLSARSIKGERAEIMEAVALDTSEIVGNPLKNISFPIGSIVIGIVRGDNQFIIPTGDSIIQPGDRIIILADRKAIPKVEKILTVKLEFF
ncbi:MAG: Trk system potassium transporter TrkA [Thermodesulfobacteriota bacterium]